jgi:hypothetical protein
MKSEYYPNQENASDTKFNTVSVTQANFPPKTNIQPVEGIHNFDTLNTSKEIAENNETRIFFVNEGYDGFLTKAATRGVTDTGNPQLNIKQETPLLSTFQENLTNKQFQNFVNSLFGYLMKGKGKVGIYYGCTANIQCPDHAHCIKRGCGPHRQCLCKEGFMPNVNGTRCVQGRAIYT